MNGPFLIGIDLGTTNGKVSCYDRHGQLQAAATHSYLTHMPGPGWYEQNPSDWLPALEQSLREVHAQLGSRAASVAALAVSSFGPGLVAFDRTGAPLLPCPTWQDERSRPQGERLVAAVGSNWIGLAPPLTGFPAKLLWTLEEHPEVATQAVCISDIKGFLLHWLTGQAATDPSSGPGKEQWWAPVFEYIGWPLERLPRVVAPTSQVGGLCDDLARRVGFKAGTPVFAGINDGAAATIGSGAVHVHDSVVTLATNGVSRLVLAHPLDVDTILSRHLFSWPLLDDLWVCGGMTYSGASSLQWLADLVGIPRDVAAYDALLAEAAQAPAGSRGAYFIPYLAGRGTPQADPTLRGGFVNLAMEHSRPDLTRAVLEGVAFAVREIYDEFTRLGLQVGAIRVTGGGMRSGLWRQIVSDVLNRPVLLANGDATLGDAMVAAVGLGLYGDISTAAAAMVRPLAHEEPDPRSVAAYEAILASYTKIRDAMVDAICHKAASRPGPQPLECRGGVRNER